MEKLPASWLPREVPRAPSALSSWPQAPGWAAGRWWPISPKVSGPGCSGACALGGRRCRGGHVVPRTRAQPPAGRSRSTYQRDILCLTVPRVWAGDVGCVSCFLGWSAQVPVGSLPVSPTGRASYPFSLGLEHHLHFVGGWSRDTRYPTLSPETRTRALR